MGIPPRRTLLLVDVLVVAWVVAWLLLASATGSRVAAFAGTAQALIQLGQAEDAMGAGLEPLNNVPYLGVNVRPTTQQLHAAAAAARSGADEIAAGSRSLSQLAAAIVLLLGLFPVLFVYAPLRMLGLRDRRRLGADLRSYSGDPDFEAYLARRALANVSYSRLRRLTPTPQADADSGRTDALAGAELARLGLRRPRRRARVEPC